MELRQRNFKAERESASTDKDRPSQSRTRTHHAITLIYQSKAKSKIRYFSIPQG